MAKEHSFRSPSLFHNRWCFPLVAILALLSSSCQPKQDQQTQQPISLPDKETAFIQAIQSVKAEYDAAPNELRKSAVRTKRGKLIQKALGGSRNVSDWVGVLSDMETSGEGKAILEIKLEGTDIQVGTWNNSLSDMFDNTLIPQESPIYSAASQLKEGDRIVFSGTFLPTDANDYVKETSLTESGSMSSPEFILKFKAIKAY